MLGKQDNCQVAMSISLANNQGSLPVAWQLSLPEDWAADPERRAKAGVPGESASPRRHGSRCGSYAHCWIKARRTTACWPMLAKGVDNAFRQALSDIGLLYAVGVTSAVVIWPPDVQPLPPNPYSGMGRPPVVPRRTAALQPVSVKNFRPVAVSR